MYYIRFFSNITIKKVGISSDHDYKITRYFLSAGFHIYRVNSSSSLIGISLRNLSNSSPG